MIVDVTAFGAKGDGSADDWPAIDAAVQACRSGAVVDPADPWGTPFLPHELFFPPGVYLVSRPVNLAGLTDQGGPGDYRGFRVRGYGAKITNSPAFPAGHALVDMMASRWMTVEGLQVVGRQAAQPGIGIQLGRVSQANADENCFRDVFVTGFYGFAAVYNLASEDCRFERAYLMNECDHAFQYVGDGTAFWRGVTFSDYVAQTLTAGTPLSFNDCVYDQCRFWSGAGQPLTNQIPVQLIKASGHEFRAGYLMSSAANGAAGPYWSLMNCDNLRGLVRCEDGKGYSALVMIG